MVLVESRHPLGHNPVGTISDNHRRSRFLYGERLSGTIAAVARPISRAVRDAHAHEFESPPSQARPEDTRPLHEREMGAKTYLKSDASQDAGVRRPK
jgi:hypothetical protein